MASETALRQSRPAAPPALDLTDVRLDWSRWSRLESSFSLLLLPKQPGIFALAEEVISPGEAAALGDRRMIAVFQVSAAADLAAAVSRLFASASPLRPQLLERRCFLRFAVVSDPGLRESAARALQQWLSPDLRPSEDVPAAVEPTPLAAAQDSDPGDETAPGPAVQPPTSSARAAQHVSRPASFPLGF